MINVIVFLDNVYENSGPVQVIPGSHKHFFEEEQVDTKVEFNELTGSVSSDLDFELPLSKVESPPKME
jgi:ectoine hydroxylase-related dioxygenase (phytanoyl-CoA dioxygenase family)